MNLATTITMFGYGTSEGVSKAWDTRGRGSHKVAPEPSAKLAKEWDTNYKKEYNTSTPMYQEGHGWFSNTANSPHTKFHPFKSSDGNNYVGARNANGKLVGGANLYGYKGPGGHAAANINMVHAHERGAGDAILSNLKNNYHLLKSEAETPAGAKALRQAGFKAVGKSGIGDIYVWSHPSVKAAHVKQFVNQTT